MPPSDNPPPVSELKHLPPVAPGSVQSRADALSLRAMELVEGTGMPHGAAVRQAYIELSNDMRTPLPFAAKVVLALLALVVLAFAVPVIGWVIGYVIAPIWHDAFAWVG